VTPRGVCASRRRRRSGGAIDAAAQTDRAPTLSASIDDRNPNFRIHTHDYVVIGPDGDPVGTMERTTEIVKERARRALGLGPDDPLPGEPGFDPVSFG
jgi:hypothetical protein